MYEQFFGLSENPFSLTPDPRFIFASRSHDEALAHLRYWVEHREGFAMITGEVGTGKTTALFRLIEGMDRHFEIAFLTNSTLSAVELLEEICRKFRIDVERDLSKPALLSRLESYLTRLNDMGHGAVLIIDEAQNFDHLLLEEVRLLSNVTKPGGSPLLQIALVGQPELDRKLTSPELRQLKQRIGVHYRIEPLSEEETGRYVHHRVSVAGGYPRVLFPAPTVAVLFQRTHGLPREINQVASQSLLHAYVEESTSVRTDHILSAIEEMGFKSVLDRPTLTVTPPGPARPATVLGPGGAQPLVANAPKTTVPTPAAAPPAPPETSRPALRAAPPAVPGDRPGPRRPATVSEPRTAAARERSPRRPETVPEPVPVIGGGEPPAVEMSTRLRAEPRPSPPAAGTNPQPPSFGALPTVRSTTGSEPKNPLLRRLAITAAAIVILGAGAFLLFAPPKSTNDDVSTLESESTMPVNRQAGEIADPVTPGNRVPVQAGTGPAAAPVQQAPGPTGPAATPAQPAPGPTAQAAVTTPPTPTPIPKAPTPATPDDVMASYHLQVATLRDSNTAESLGRQLARLGNAAFHVDRSPGGAFPWYAVYVGPYATRAEAESARAELTRLDRDVEGAIVRPPSTR